MKDVKTWGLLVALLLAIVWLLRHRQKPPLEQTTVSIIGARSESGELNPSFSSDIKNQLDQVFDRICKYGDSSINWPSLGDPCPPSLNGVSLTSDELIQKV